MTKNYQGTDRPDISATDRPPHQTRMRVRPRVVPFLFDDVTSVALRSAVAGLAARQRAISQNIANIETPGYRAQRVSFEDDLSRAVADGDSPDVAPTTATSLEPTRLDGNNVNLDTETMSSVDTTLRYQLSLRAIDSEFSVLRAAMRTS